MKRIAILLAIVVSTTQGLRSRLELTVNCKKNPGIGKLYFAQLSPSSPIEITGEMRGVNPGEYHVYVHDKNDTTNRCDSMGPITKKSDGQLYHVFTAHVPKEGAPSFTMAPGPLTFGDIVDKAVAFHWPPSSENGEMTVDPYTLGCGIIIEDSQSPPQIEIQKSTTARTSPQSEIHEPATSSVDKTTKAIPLENASGLNSLVLTVNCKIKPGVGTFHFAQASSSSPIQITGEMHGVNPGEYYVYMHDKNDTTNHCNSMGPITKRSDGQLYHVFTVNIAEGGPQTFTVAPGLLTLGEVVNRPVAFHWPPTSENGIRSVDASTLGCGIIKEDSQPSPQDEVPDLAETASLPPTSTTPQSQIQNSTTSSISETTTTTPLENAHEMEHRLVVTINSKSGLNVGKIYFTQAHPSAPVRISGDFEFLPGEFYAYLHDKNDVSNRCNSLGKISRNSNGRFYHLFNANIPEEGPRTLTMAPGSVTLDDIANRAIGLHWNFVMGENKTTPHPNVIACGIIRKEAEQSIENEREESTTASENVSVDVPHSPLISVSLVAGEKNSTTSSAQDVSATIPLPDEKLIPIRSCSATSQESKPIDVLVSKEANETCVSQLCYQKLCCKMDAMRTITCRPLTGSQC